MKNTIVFTMLTLLFLGTFAGAVVTPTISVSNEPSTPITDKEIFFSGKGFVTNEQNSQKESVNLHLLKSGENLEGKIILGSITYRAEGFDTNVNDEDFFFTLYDSATNQPVGTFNGKVERSDVKIVRGDLAIAHDDWTISDWKLYASEPIAPLPTPKPTPEPFPTPNLKVDISPRSQKTNDGSAVYTLKIADLHEQECADTSENSRACERRSYKYILYFKPQTRMSGEFSSPTISLNSEESTAITLRISDANEETNIFSVLIENADSPSEKLYTKGVLYNSKMPNNQRPSTPIVDEEIFFAGQGFAINEQTSKGYFAELRITTSGEKLEGKMSMNSKSYKIEGLDTTDTNNGNYWFTLYDARTGEPVGVFNGKVESFNDFKLLKGDLAFVHRDWTISDWKLTAFSKQKSDFGKTISPTKERETEFVGEQEIITILPYVDEERTTENTEGVVTGMETGRVEEATSENPEKESYIRTVEVKKAKLFNIIPKFWSDEKAVDIEIIEKDKVTRKTINEFSSKNFNGYKIEVGSLENKENIEVSVSKN